MIEAVKEIDNVKLVIAGAGVDADIITKATQQTNKISYIGYISYDKLIKYTMQADLLLHFMIHLYQIINELAPTSYLKL